MVAERAAVPPRLTAVPEPVTEVPALDIDLHLIAAALRSTARAVVALSICPEDFADPHHGRLWETITDLVAEGIDPAAALVLARLDHDGRRAELLRKRLLDATTTAAHAVALPHYAAAVAESAFRRRVSAYAEAVAQGAEELPVGDVWAAVVAGGAELRTVRDRLIGGVE